MGKRAHEKCSAHGGPTRAPRPARCWVPVLSLCSAVAFDFRWFLFLMAVSLFFLFLIVLKRTDRQMVNFLKIVFEAFFGNVVFPGAGLSWIRASGPLVRRRLHVEWFDC